MTDTSKIISLVDESPSCHHWTVKDMLEHALKKIEEGGDMVEAESALLVLMTKKGPTGRRVILNVRLSDAEAIAALALVQSNWMNDINS